MYNHHLLLKNIVHFYCIPETIEPVCVLNKIRMFLITILIHEFLANICTKM